MSDGCDLLCLDLEKAESARSTQPPARTLDRWARSAKAFGDPTRLAIAVALRDSGRACGCDVAWIVGRDDKLVSHHLRALKNAGAALSVREGKVVFYELTPTGAALLEALTATETHA